jgi:hypothetical protein
VVTTASINKVKESPLVALNALTAIAVKIKKATSTGPIWLVFCDKSTPNTVISSNAAAAITIL